MFEQFDDLFIQGLLEVLVPGTYSHEVRRRFQAEQLLNLLAEPVSRLCSTHWHGEYKASRILPAERLYRCPGCHSGGDAIVHQDDSSFPNLKLGTLIAEKFKAPLGFRSLFGRYPFDVIFGDADLSDAALVIDPRAVLCNGADSELRLVRSLKLARYKDVKRRLKGASDLIAYRDPSLGSASTTGSSALLLHQLLSELPTSVFPIPGRRSSKVHAQYPQYGDQ